MMLSFQQIFIFSFIFQSVVGQDHALEAISDCVRLARTRLQAQDRTLGNFLFLGPTGERVLILQLTPLYDSV